MTRLHPDMSIRQRQALIAEVLEKVLDRGPEMSVEPGGDPGTLYVWVLKGPHLEQRIGHSLHDIARELEVLL